MDQFMPANLTPADLAWCAAGAQAVYDGMDVDGEADTDPRYPFISRGVVAWFASQGGDPADVVKGAFTPGNLGFRLTLPAKEQLNACFRKDAAAKTGFLTFLAATLLHELTHFRQQDAIITSLPDEPLPEEYLAYYQNIFEQEAHGAQIAYDLVSGSLPIDLQTMKATPVGARISERLAPLENGPRAVDVNAVHRDILHEVNLALQALTLPS